jgi:hypothetical protein
MTARSSADLMLSPVVSTHARLPLCFGRPSSPYYDVNHMLMAPRSHEFLRSHQPNIAVNGWSHHQSFQVVAP